MNKKDDDDDNVLGEALFFSRLYLAFIYFEAT